MQEPNYPQRDREKEREVYKYFDEAVITVKVPNVARYSKFVVTVHCHFYV